MKGRPVSELLLQVEAGVARAMFNRPEQRNPLSLEMRAEMRRFLQAAGEDPAIRCVVFTGAGGHFMGGGDVQVFHRTLQELQPAARREFFEDRIATLPPLIEAIRQCPKPVIAEVHGACAGVGMAILLTCDLAYASANAFFTTAYVHLGAPPDGGLSHSLVDLLGRRRATELLMLGERFDAARAYEFGMLNAVFPAEDCTEKTMAVARKLAAGPALSYRATKALVAAAPDRGLIAQMMAERRAFADITGSADFAEGVSAFIEKRPAVFRGQ